MLPPEHERRRAWPGLDGWLLVVLTAMSGATWAVRGGTGLGDFGLLGAALTALWLTLAWMQRHYVPAPLPRPAGVRPLVVIPTQNNHATIAEIVRGCLEHHPDVLVLDDGSVDGTGDLAREAGGTVVAHPRNLGKGAALESCLEWAAQHGFSHIIAIDADGQHYPDDLPAFITAIRQQPHAIHAGLRDMSKAPDTSRYARANSNFWVFVETSTWVGDTQCGFRAYPVHAIRDLALPPSRYQWEVEVLVRAIWAGIPVLDLPHDVFYPPADERVSSYRKVRDTVLVTWKNTTLVAGRILWPPRWLKVQPRSEWRGSSRGVLWGWRIVIAALGLFGRRALHIAMVPLAGFYWLFAGTQRAAVEHYLSLRNPSSTPMQRHIDAYWLMLNFARSLIDRFVILLHGPDAIPVDRTEAKLAKEKIYGSKGVLVLSAHVGNPDLIGAGLQSRGDRRVNLVLHAAQSDHYLALFRERAGDAAPSIIALSGGESMASLEVMRALRRDEVVAIKVDRQVDARQADVTLLGHKASFPTGPLLLAALSGAEVMLVGCFVEPDGSYRVLAEAPRVYRFESRRTREADLQRWAQEIADTLDKWTARYPLQWYNFHQLWTDEQASDPKDAQLTSAAP